MFVPIQHISVAAEEIGSIPQRLQIFTKIALLTLLWKTCNKILTFSISKKANFEFKISNYKISDHTTPKIKFQVFRIWSSRNMTHTCDWITQLNFLLNKKSGNCFNQTEYTLLTFPSFNCKICLSIYLISLLQQIV